MCSRTRTFLQGSEATQIERGGKFYAIFLCKFINDYSSERIIEIGPSLPKLS